MWDEGAAQIIARRRNVVGFLLYAPRIGARSFPMAATVIPLSMSATTLDLHERAPSPRVFSRRARCRMDWTKPSLQTLGANAYPLINYEYAIVSSQQGKPEIAAAIRKFLLWAIAPDETNEKYFADTHFIPLPAHIWVLSHDQVEMIR
jgi:hypothetical protein